MLRSLKNLRDRLANAERASDLMRSGLDDAHKALRDVESYLDGQRDLPPPIGEGAESAAAPAFDREEVEELLDELLITINGGSTHEQQRRLKLLREAVLGPAVPETAEGATSAEPATIVPDIPTPPPAPGAKVKSHTVAVKAQLTLQL